MSLEQYKPINNKFRIIGYLISLIGLFQIIIPQNQWIIIPAIIQNFYTLRALKDGPHKDIFAEVRQGNLLRILLIGFVVFIFISGILGLLASSLIFNIISNSFQNQIPKQEFIKN